MRVTVRSNEVGVIMPLNLAQELYNLCCQIRKGKRLQVTDAIHAVAGEVMLAVLASEQILVLPKKENEDA